MRLFGQSDRPAARVESSDPTQAAIDRIVRRVHDPESGLPIADLGLLRRVRVAANHRVIYLDVPFDQRTPGCMACTGIAMTIIYGIRRDLRAAFESEFPGYRIEFI